MMTECNIKKKNWETIKKELERRNLKFEVLGDGFNRELDGAGIEDTIWDRPDMFRVRIEGISGNQLHKLILSLGIIPSSKWD